MKKRNNKVFYGWKILIALWLIYFLSFSTICYGSNILTVQMVQEFHMNEALIGWSTSAYFAGQLVFSVVGGMLADRKGLHFCIVMGCITIMLGSFINFFFQIPAVLYIVLFMVLGAGCLMAGVVTGPAVINAWFDQNKSLPMAIFMSSGSFGGFVMPVISERLSSMIGWKGCWMLYAALAFLSIFIAYFFIKNHPEEMGEVRDGIKWRKNHHLPLMSNENISKETFTLKKAFQNRTFLKICITIFGVRLIYAAFLGYFVYFAIESGIPAVIATAALSSFHICGMIGRLAAGVRLRLPVNVINGIVYCGLGVGGVLLSIAHNVPGFFLAAMVIGLFHNYAYTYLAVQIPIYFGSKNYASYYSITGLIGSISNTLGPILVSAFVVFCGYRVIFLMLGIIAIAGAGLAVVTRPQR